MFSSMMYKVGIAIMIFILILWMLLFYTYLF